MGEDESDPLDTFETHGREQIRGEAKKTGNGAHVLVPKRWRGCEVKVIRVTDPDDTNN